MKFGQIFRRLASSLLLVQAALVTPVHALIGQFEDVSQVIFGTGCGLSLIYRDNSTSS